MFAFLGMVLIAVGIWGFWAGEVMAGSRGLRANKYRRDEQPGFFYFFVVMYVLAGLFIASSQPWPWAGG
jgi:hypothetical protein